MKDKILKIEGVRSTVSSVVLYAHKHQGTDSPQKLSFTVVPV